MEKKSKKKSFERYDQLLLKIVSFVLAVFIVLIVKNHQVREEQRPMVVNIKLGTAGYVITNGAERKKMVLVSGSFTALRSLPPVELEATIWIDKPKEGTRTIYLSASHIQHLPKGVKVNIPNRVLTVEIDKVSTKKVKVKPVLQGVPKAGFFVEKVKVVPPTVELSGGQKDVVFVDEVSTQVIDINEISEKQYFKKALNLENLKSVTADVENVSVEVNIAESKENKKFTDIIIKPINTKFKKIKIVPTKVTVEIQGTNNILNFTKRSDIEAVVDLDSLQKGVHDRPVTVKIPSGSTLIETNPGNVSVKILE